MPKTQLAIVPSAATGARRTQRVPKDQLDSFDSHSHVEALVLQRLGEALRAASTEVIGACMELKVLPWHLLNGVEMLQFLSRYAFAAHYAESIVGIPSSILLADAWYSASDSRPHPETNDVFQTNQRYQSVDAAFVDRASFLACSPKFRGVRAAIGDRKSYLSEIRKCRVWRTEEAQERAKMIEENGLHECDFPKLP